MSKTVAALAAALSLLAAAPAVAIPAGSYQQTCKDIKLKSPDSDSARLQAKCVDGKGEWRRTSFELDRCWGDLANFDGELVCVADQRHGGPGFASREQYARYHDDYPPVGGPPPGAPGRQPLPIGEPKDVAVDVCVDWAVREAYRGGAGFARLLRIEDIDRKDAGRIKLKGIILAADHRESRKTRDMPFRCDSRHGRIVEFRWR
ncbi:MAG: CVNH domain-containing protein [Sphingomonadales bacterium]